MQDSQSAGPKPASRRGFFFSAATVGAAAAAVTVLPKVAPEPTAPAAAALKPAPEKGGGYTLSEHVKQYYKTTSV
jgi:hypothetical protein